MVSQGLDNYAAGLLLLTLKSHGVDVKRGFLLSEGRGKPLLVDGGLDAKTPQTVVGLLVERADAHFVVVRHIVT